MKKLGIRMVSMLVALMMVFSIVPVSVAAENEVVTAGYQSISPKEAQALILNGATIIDVRTIDAYATGHIKGAFTVPTDKFTLKNPIINELQFEDSIILYCQQGVTSRLSAELLNSWGFSQVFNLCGGFQEWVLLFGEESVSTRQLMTYGDITFVLREGLHIEIEEISKSHANKQVASVRTNNDVRILRAVLRDYGFTPRFNEAEVLQLGWSDTQTGNGVFTNTFLPFRDRNKLGREAVISFQEQVKCSGESSYVIEATIIKPINENHYTIRTYQIQDGVISEKEITIYPGQPNSFCTWAMAALCGIGGGAACWALAVALGIKTLGAGFGISVICGLIASLGCAGATIVVCE